MNLDGTVSTLDTWRAHMQTSYQPLDPPEVGETGFSTLADALAGIKTQIEPDLRALQEGAEVVKASIAHYGLVISQDEAGTWTWFAGLPR